MSLRAPTVKRGQRLTAGLWNELARAVNSGLAAPRDIDAGRDEEELPDVTLRETSRSTVIVRVENPEDPEQYVEVQRITRLTTRNESDGQLVETVFDE